MRDDSRGFDEVLARDDDGVVRIRSTCKRCGVFRLVNAGDGSLRKWENEHVCPDAPKKQANSHPNDRSAQ